MDFREVAAQMFSLYADGDYQGALGVVQAARPHLSEEDNVMTFWEACLLARTGRHQDSVATLASGVERGHWWSTGRLLDTDLDPVRSLPAFIEVAEHCARITEEMKTHRPVPIIRQGSGIGSVVTIQGAHANQVELARTWAQAVPTEWTVITPAGSEPVAEGEWGWPHSIEIGAANLLAELDVMSPLNPPIVFTGFSIGAAIASHIINATDQRVDGLIAVAPSSTDRFSELIDAARAVPALIIGGEEDSRADHYRRLQNELAGVVDTKVEIVNGLGHFSPGDLDRRVQTLLKRVAVSG